MRVRERDADLLPAVLEDENVRDFGQLGEFGVSVRPYIDEVADVHAWNRGKRGLVLRRIHNDFADALGARASRQRRFVLDLARVRLQARKEVLERDDLVRRGRNLRRERLSRGRRTQWTVLRRRQKRTLLPRRRDDHILIEDRVVPELELGRAARLLDDVEDW